SPVDCSRSAGRGRVGASNDSFEPLTTLTKIPVLKGAHGTTWRLLIRRTWPTLRTSGASRLLCRGSSSSRKSIVSRSRLDRDMLFLALFTRRYRARSLRDASWVDARRTRARRLARREPPSLAHEPPAQRSHPTQDSYSRGRSPRLPRSPQPPK